MNPIYVLMTMNRRQFIHKSVKTFAMTMLGGLGASARTGNAYGSEAMMRYRYGKGPSLKAIALKKLHHRDGRFVNLFGPQVNGRLDRLLKWKLFSPNHFKQFYDQESEKPLTVDWGPVYASKGLSVTFLKHASLLIKDAGNHILIDPIFGPISRFIKDFTPFGFDPVKIPKPDQVLVTHGHYDHLDKDTLGRYRNSSHFISPLGYEPIFEDIGLKKTTTLDWFEKTTTNGRTITLLPCHHWTMRNPLVGPNRALWGSFLIETKTGPTIYVAGDSAYFEGFKEIGERYNIDLAIINLGAYEPRWFMAPSHINPEETVQALQDLKAERLLVVHWGTFRLGDEPVHFPPLQVRAALKKEGLIEQLVDIAHGETYILT